MAFATSEDVEAALGRSLTGSEDVDSLLEEASDLVAGYLLHIPDPVPSAVKRATATMVAAVLTKPDVTVAQYDAGGYNQVREAAGVRVGVESSTTAGPWLTNSIKQRLRPYRRAAMSVLMVGENYGS
jgi:hypothetical protein